MNKNLLRLFFFSTPIVSVISSNALVPIVVVIGLMSCFFRYLESGTFIKFSRLQLGLLAGFFSWISISLIWTISPENALKLDLRLLGLTITGLLLISTAEVLSPINKNSVTKALLAGCILGAILLLIEVSFEAPVTRFLKGKTDDEWIELSRFNRAASFLGISCWALFAIYARYLHRFLRVLLPVIPLTISYFSPSESTLFAVVMASLWYLIFYRIPRVGFLLLPVVLIVSMMAMPNLVRELAPLHGPESSQKIPFSAKHRFFIWEFVGTQIAENPIVGWGFDASRDYPNKGSENYTNIGLNGVESVVEGRIISLHPHNFALQVWLELGVIGILLITGILLSYFRYLKKLQLEDNLAIQAMIVATFILALLGYGVWQNRWFVMFFIFAAMIPLVKPSTKTDK